MMAIHRYGAVDAGFISVDPNYGLIELKEAKMRKRLSSWKKLIRRVAILTLAFCALANSSAIASSEVITLSSEVRGTEPGLMSAAHRDRKRKRTWRPHWKKNKQKSKTKSLLSSARASLLSEATYREALTDPWKLLSIARRAKRERSKARNTTDMNDTSRNFTAAAGTEGTKSAENVEKKMIIEGEEAASVYAGIDRNSTSSPIEKKVVVAVIGCLHGQLETAYETLKTIERKSGILIDFVIVAGDFQAIRNEEDLSFMVCPPKYRQMGTFFKYYNGELLAPYLTYYVGGNHEASNFHAELPEGGWVAPNIFYMGYCGVVESHGLRIAGISGIYNKYDYRAPRSCAAAKVEITPSNASSLSERSYHNDTVEVANPQNHGGEGRFFRRNHYDSSSADAKEYNRRSMYHVRECDIDALIKMALTARKNGGFKEEEEEEGEVKKQETEPANQQQQRGDDANGMIDILISHDWPRNITDHGNVRKLLWKKRFLKNDIRSRLLGNPGATRLMKALKPRYYFAAHLHTKFAALVEHDNDGCHCTRFLALDKVVPGRDFVQILEIPTSSANNKSRKG